MNQQLAEKIVSLACARRSVELQALAVDAALGALEETEAFKSWRAAKNAKQDAEKAEAAVDAEVRELALASGEKQPHPAVQIITTSVLEYQDKDAVAWCIQTQQLSLLKIDTRAFEKVARTLEIQGVIRHEKPGVRIASNLRQYEQEACDDRLP
jgi:hypothetical protein